jgi:MSHA biogenesis protein MshL
MKIKPLLLMTMLAVTTMTMVACTSSIYKEANTQYQKTTDDIKQHEMAAHKKSPPVVIKPGYYVDARPIHLKRDPEWMKSRVSMQAHKMPLTILMHRLLRNSNINVTYDNTVLPRRLVSFDYTGSLRGALENIAAQTNYHFSLGKAELNWSAFVTKTFNISFMPGVSHYLVGRTRNNNQSNSSQHSGQGTHISRVDDQQYSTLEGQLSVWQDLRNTLNQLKSKEGRVIISESTTTATIIDHPSNLQTIAGYIDQLNQSLSQEVSIRVQVLDIELNKDFNFGVNWNLVAHNLGKNFPDFNLMGNMATATNLAANSMVEHDRNSALVGLRIGNMNGASSLMSALSKQGKLRVVTKPEVVTMNNQIASIRITQDTSYVESVNQTYAQNYVTTSIKPGTVTDGFTLYLLPKIQGNRVYMQISSTISNLIRLEKQSTIPSGVAANERGNSQYNAIEVPTIAEKVFNQRSVVRSGSTLIIAGYKRLRDETSNAKLFGLGALGGKGAHTKNVETLVLITPTILRIHS